MKNRLGLNKKEIHDHFQRKDVQLKMERGMLEISIDAIERFWEHHANVMKSRENIPSWDQPMDASYWMNTAPCGNVSEMRKRIEEINKELECFTNICNQDKIS